jgi:hypothetical protein
LHNFEITVIVSLEDLQKPRFELFMDDSMAYRVKILHSVRDEICCLSAVTNASATTETLGKHYDETHRIPDRVLVVPAPAAGSGQNQQSCRSLVPLLS